MKETKKVAMNTKSVPEQIHSDLNQFSIHFSIQTDSILTRVKEFDLQESPFDFLWEFFGLVSNFSEDFLSVAVRERRGPGSIGGTAFTAAFQFVVI